ncbi:hypothetical protein E2542_SST19645 [Spatholobus suberectus]|nr:hypothetical protein E2542_SST19645 [Spatholobus suberectus]
MAKVQPFPVCLKCTEQNHSALILECKYSPYCLLEYSGYHESQDPVAEKHAKGETLRAKVQEENTKHEKSVNVAWAMTLNNQQMGCQHVLQGMVGFSSVCMVVFKSVYNKAKVTEQEHDVKRILPRKIDLP